MADPAMKTFDIIFEGTGTMSGKMRNDVTVNARLHWRGEQSGRDPYTTAPVGFDLDIDFDSPANKEDQLRLIAAAKKGCFIETTLMQGLEVGHRLQIDGDWHDA
jgi:hypothetical protein